MSPGEKHSVAKLTIRSGSTSAIVKFSEIPSPWIAVTDTPSASRLSRILSLRLSTYGVITPTRSGFWALIVRRTDAATLTVGEPVCCEIASISSASYWLPRNAPALVHANTTTSGRAVARSTIALGTCSSSITDSPSGVVSSRNMRAVCTEQPSGRRV